jgi:hypothetical protein
MKALLLAAACLSSGCAAVTGSVPARGGPAMVAASAAPARSQSGSTRTQGTGGQTQTIGLPLGRAGKIGLWTGVAVFLAYLMHSDGDDGADATGP